MAIIKTFDEYKKQGLLEKNMSHDFKCKNDPQRIYAH